MATKRQRELKRKKYERKINHARKRLLDLGFSAEDRKEVDALKGNIFRWEGMLGEYEKTWMASPNGKKKKGFYDSGEWRAIRYKALKAYGRECSCCGAHPGGGVVLHVDHIKPRSKHPELELDINNLQILCADCNLGKSNYDEIKWR